MILDMNRGIQREWLHTKAAMKSLLKEQKSLLLGLPDGSTMELENEYTTDGGTEGLLVSKPTIKDGFLSKSAKASINKELAKGLPLAVHQQKFYNELLDEFPNQG